MAGKKEDECKGAGEVKSGSSKGASGKKGLAPFASLEDLSDDSPPDDKTRLTLPGIKEDPTPSPGRTNITPRIDISRASSSSHHDDSSPERELFAGTSEGAGSGSGGAKTGLGFTEEMAMELRSSTEELDFHDPEDETKSRRKKLHQQQAVNKYELEAQSEKDIRERKDSGCSEGGLLLITGGRSSRLSSIGSVASGGSAASHCSAHSGQSHLSAVSNLSKTSRCSSPHKMLLETSFCGPKPIPTLSLEAEYPPQESVEATLLARKGDITGAILPNDESIQRSMASPTKPFSSKTSLDIKSSTSKSNTTLLDPNPSKTKATRTQSERIAKPSGAAQSVQQRSSSARSNLKRPETRKKRNDENELVRIIPLHGSLDDDSESPVEAEPDKKTDDSGYTPEYGIYIPLKGPIIEHTKKDEAKPQASSSSTVTSDTKRKKPDIEESDLVRFISLHGDDDDSIQRAKTESSSRPSFSRNGQNVQFRPWTDDPPSSQLKDKHLKKPRTPEPMSKCKPSTLDVKSKNGRPAQSMTHLPRDESRTPSPASSFARGGLFRRSSDSSGSSKKSANTSGSSDTKTKKDSKNKSMFTSLFKKNVKESPTQKAREKPVMDPKIMNVEFKFKQEEPDSIIIPLHSPDGVTKPNLFNEADAIVPDISGETEQRTSKYVSPRESLRKEDDFMRSMKEAIENKNIIVVDVINSDTAVCYEAVIETPRIHRSTSRNRNDRTSDIDVLELENLEVEPRVRRSSHCSTRDSEVIEKDPSTSDIASRSKTEETQVKSRPQSQEIKKEINMEMEVTVEPVEEIVQPTPPLMALTPEPKPNQVEDPAKELKNELSIDRGSIKSQLSKEETEDKRSSGSEMDLTGSQVEEPKVEECDEERKGLFHQMDSVEDELPYVPTTLPQERSVAVPIIPVKQRVSEVRTCPVDRPRSTTPIQPSNLDEYAAAHDSTATTRAQSSEKMQIILPRTDSIGRSKSPGRPKPWAKFAEEGLHSPKEVRKRVGSGGGEDSGRSSSDSDPPGAPPLPPRGAQWVMFDEHQPERRRTPRRITTLPSSSQPHTSSSPPVYSYVNPEECSCECHEAQGSIASSQCSSDSDRCSYKKYTSRTDKENRNRI